ncbi:uncharacterized protein [Antedon mediterranea]|uniref:uncharacterized protein n=1 Tax=Antedon mediterranea TaxID=105859 RepID=UPI003AF527A0
MENFNDVDSKALVPYNSNVQEKKFEDENHAVRESREKRNSRGMLVFSPQSNHGTSSGTSIVKNSGDEGSAISKMSKRKYKQNGKQKDSGDESGSQGILAFSPKSNYGTSPGTSIVKNGGDEVDNRANVVFSPNSAHGNSSSTNQNGVKKENDIHWKTDHPSAQRGVGTQMAFVLDRPRIDGSRLKIESIGTESFKGNKQGKSSTGKKSSEKQNTTDDDASSVNADASYHGDCVHDIVEYFATDVTTLHALPNVFKSCTLLAKSLWAIVFMTGVFLFLFQASFVINKYRDGPIQVNLEVVTKSSLEFPKVTICNTNKLRRSAVANSKYRQVLIVDELKSLPYYAPCIEDDFQCVNELICVKPYLICDGVNQCRDFSDEYDCTYPSCKEGFFRCSNGSNDGVCIASSRECDRVVDCYDGADENECVCKGTEYKCVSRGGCIDKSKVCNGIDDCADKSDEKDCDVGDDSTECGDDAFQCWDVDECINRQFLCDGYYDCKDGSDEDPTEVCFVPSTVAPTPTCK